MIQLLVHAAAGSSDMLALVVGQTDDRAYIQEAYSPITLTIRAVINSFRPGVVDNPITAYVSKWNTENFLLNLAQLTSDQTARASLVTDDDAIVITIAAFNQRGYLRVHANITYFTDGVSAEDTPTEHQFIGSFVVEPAFLQEWIAQLQRFLHELELE